MATIYKAHDRETGQTVVLKVPHPEFERNLRNASRFAREAAIVGKLDHPGILKVIPVAQKSRPYVVMEYLHGETLAGILERTRPLPICAAVQLTSRLCEILDYIHRHDVIHCDLKPGNIIIADDGSPHIIDFGIAQAPAWFSSKTGTPEYMAPEQILGDKVDARTDIYSLGAVLYEIVTGVRARSESLPSTPRELNSNLSEQVEEIILHAMAPNPSDRYASAAAMKADLDSPEDVQVTGKFKTFQKASAWPRNLRVAGLVLGLASSPFLLFYLFLKIFQSQLARHINP
jgi:eukaryotic-like serine/threonine-protein kinase